ncbi:MAG: hypothetical protein WKF97_15825 [Chitinophagaceae bacterium]
MRQNLFLAYICTILLACTKPDDVKKIIEDNLDIISTTTPASIVKGQEIISTIQCQGPNLCYSFHRLEITETSPRQFEIRAKAHVQGSVCAMALYRVDTVARIPALTSGQYLLRFYNASRLFKTDTVQVN